MQSLIMYDSMFGNTEKIARAIGAGVGTDARVLRADEAKLSDLESINLLIVGSPTQGGRPMPALQKLLSDIPAGTLKNKKVAAFDTRFSIKDQNIALRMLMKTIGYAADKINKLLISKGGVMTVLPEGFIVTGKEGPLMAGELERATAWGKQLVNMDNNKV